MKNNLKLFLIEHWYPRNKTDGDLADALGVDRTLVSKWLNDVVEPPIERKIHIAKVLGIDSRLLFPENTKEDCNG